MPKIDIVDIREKVEEIVILFMDEEAELLTNNSSEQAITHRLAVMLEQNFNGWNVDCEYNRNQDTIKRLRYTISPDRPIEERDVVPDIIVHKRMTENNLLVIEVKKSTNPESEAKDLAKLSAFKEQLGYQNALFIRFLVGTDKPNIQHMEWV
ncbi:MAG: hypothetical protein JMN24_15785 [gamma proteobacterium endosymbiont of Lamellibrachia anaximandri]|nr:hypothetical protein [gamma proteobacterium endosymbiont of Lamellibrachia anaximandri]MBL3619051.1 hypothetical protein [gamma proteobacterium endosymbiont of Lamellibrachia anaximandri]